MLEYKCISTEKGTLLIFWEINAHDHQVLFIQLVVD